MIKISSGTAGVLGLSKVKPKVAPTTAYAMLGSGCQNNCKFCSQSHESNSDSEFLSRVDWNNYDEDDVFQKVKEAYDDGKIKRLCFQVIDGKDSMKSTITMIEKLKKVCQIPVCASSTAKTVEDGENLFKMGLDRMCVALDAASSEVYNAVKGEGYLKKIEYITELSKSYPGKVTTHLIVGLGESEMDMTEIIAYFSNLDVVCALFAFTPLKGTQMENYPQPEIGRYRKIQVLNYLLQNKHITIKDIEHENGVIKGFKDKDKKKLSKSLLKIISDSEGIPFRTSGCPDCNRPYYNETTNSTPYNYPTKMTKKDIESAIKLSGLF
jgi:biotin synthase